MKKIAINGFGRIGRQAFKVALTKDNVEVVAINDLTDAKTLAHLLKYDSAYGQYNKKVEYDETNIIVDGQKFPVLAVKDPAELPWGEMGVNTVLECTGRFRSVEDASKHLTAGAKRVILSAPGKGTDIPTYVRGINCDNVGGEEKNIINNASCTTNCISPVMKVMTEKFGVEKAMMSTVHGYTSDQNLQDGPHKDLRRARAAAVNIVPTTTGAATATTQVIPEIAGVFDGLAIRVPVPTVSLTDITLLLKKSVTKEEINQALKEASETSLQGILAVTDEELVSSDFVGSSYSSIVDTKLTNVVGGNLVKIIAWYDNEVGYSHRLVELAIKY
jgi:glyceraldehyde 3-phosphate dehydrogenase